MTQNYFPVGNSSIVLPTCMLLPQKLWLQNHPSFFQGKNDSCLFYFFESLEHKIEDQKDFFL